MLIHSVCSMCPAEWDTEVKPDPALADDPGYMALHRTVVSMISGCKPLCDACVERHTLAEMHERVNRDMKDAIFSEYIRPDTPRCTFASSHKDIEALNDGWQTARELAYDAGFTCHCSAFIYGPPGTGKTYLARCLLNAAAELRGYQHVMETNARQYIHAVMQNDKRLWKMQRVFFLLLDDIDKAIWKQETLQILWELLDMRSAGQFTAVTSNADPALFSRMLRDACAGNTSIAEATMGRLNPCVKIEMKGKSLRRPV